MSDRVQVWMLRRKPRGRDLDGYVFKDERHAREWMAQIDDPAARGYFLQRRWARRVECPCGNSRWEIGRLVDDALLAPEPEGT